MLYTQYASPVGNLLLVSDGAFLTGLYMDTQPPEGAMHGEDPVLRRTRQWLDGYFQGTQPEADIPLAASGTAFQKLVWQLLAQIPYGQVRTYGELAREAASLMGKEKMSAQAVGQAVGSNPISILVPCHRVVGSGGKLTGYAWGMEKKQWLLKHEGSDAFMRGEGWPL